MNLRDSEGSHDRLYPRLGQQTPDKIGQVHAKLDMLNSPGMKNPAYRSARAYDLWQLAELAHDDSCRAAIMQADFVPNVVFLLQDQELPAMQAAAAVLVRRLAANSPGNGRELTNSGAVLPLIQLLSSSDDSCREAAALALCFLGWSSTDAKDEAFSKLCSTALESTGASTAPFPFTPLLQSEHQGQQQAAAYALHMISQDLPNEWRPYLSCGPTPALIPCLVDLLGCENPPAIYAASRTLLNLLLAPANASGIVQALVQVTNTGSPFAREQAARQLWEMAYSQGSVNQQLLGVYVSTAGLYSGISSMVHAGSAQGCGLAQMLTYEDSRTSNNVIRGPNTDSIRTRLVSEPGFLHGLARLLHHDDADVAALAAQTVANVLAYRSGGCADCARPQGSGFKAHLHRHMQGGEKAPPDSFRCPAHRFAAIDHAVNQLFESLSSSQYKLVAAALSALANLTNPDDLREHLRLDARAYREGPEALQQKLMNLMGWQPLGQRGKEAARTLYHRLEAKGGTGLSSSFFTSILPPAALPAAAPSP